MIEVLKRMCGDPPSSRIARQRGVAMVEFTIAVPVLLFLMLGVTELGRALIRFNALTKAVEAGARHAANYALLGTTQNVSLDAQLIGETQNVVVFGNPAGIGQPILPGLVAGNVTVTAVSTSEVRVDATYPYVPLFGSGIPSFGTGANTGPLAFNMASAVTMRAL